jgi:hypothetical protein
MIGPLSYFQKDGIPIGGICSSAYADISCGFDEWALYKENPEILTNTVAIRQIDDILIISDEKRKRDKIVKCYTSGLTLEDEEVKEKDGKFIAEFIGLKITIDNKIRKRLKVELEDKNLKTIKEQGSQKKGRFPVWEDIRTKQIYRNVLANRLHAILHFSIGKKSIFDGIISTYNELRYKKWPAIYILNNTRRFIERKIKSNERTIWLKAVKWIDDNDRRDLMQN